MLLNLSNHPFDTWSAVQQQEALSKYEAVKDLAFPKVHPMATTNAIQLLAQTYLHKIMEVQPTAVHLMGEMTFVYELVTLLKVHDIPCIASTSERIVYEETDGKKLVTFQFQQFRAYF